MSDPHVIGGAVGKYPIGQHRIVTVDERERFEYDVRCEDCGDLLGVVRHAVVRPDHDPAACGLICGGCSSARAALVQEPQQGEG